MRISNTLCLCGLMVMLNTAPLASAQTSGLPSFKKTESYASVRTKMLAAGWTPFRAKDADVCNKDDARCQGRPEMAACAGSGIANCKFLWKKDEKITAICTVGEVAVFDSICAYP